MAGTSINTWHSNSCSFCNAIALIIFRPDKQKAISLTMSDNNLKKINALKR
jgi:hypothetical protein